MFYAVTSLVEFCQMGSCKVCPCGSSWWPQVSTLPFPKLSSWKATIASTLQTMTCVSFSFLKNKDKTIDRCRKQRLSVELEERHKLPETNFTDIWICVERHSSCGSCCERISSSKIYSSTTQARWTISVSNFLCLFSLLKGHIIAESRAKRWQ